ncbi:MAG TPA: peptidoglycan-associated lipoprotein Pal [Caulobacteraceae bacterium]|nr:peptidoglycan-associated lipoprotein Pal [Caulobacteraceae bacterium]
MSVKTVAGRIALVALLTASMAACANRPKPDAGGGTTTPPGGQTEQPYTPPPGGGVTTQPVPGTVPGSEQDFVVNVGDRVYFDLDQHELRDDARPSLDAQAQWLARYPAVRVRIEGNADERGTREYNFALGARRAEAVRNYLVGRGVSPSRIETISYGKERPIDTGSNEEAWARNRNAHTAIVGGAR